MLDFVDEPVEMDMQLVVLGILQDLLAIVASRSSGSK